VHSLRHTWFYLKDEYYTLSKLIELLNSHIHFMKFFSPVPHFVLGGRDMGGQRTLNCSKHYHSFMATTCIITQQLPPLVPVWNHPVACTCLLRNHIEKIPVIDPVCVELRNAMSTSVLNPYRPKTPKILFNPMLPRARKSSAL
jgi:hypothetical protein